MSPDNQCPVEGDISITASSEGTQRKLIILRRLKYAAVHDTWLDDMGGFSTGHC